MSRAARPLTVGLAALLLALCVAACGGNQKPNKVRAPAAVETTVKIDNKQVVVSPNRFDFSKNGGLRQPASAPQVEAEQQGKRIKATTQTTPDTTAPQPVHMTIVNLSDEAASLEVRGPVHITSDVIAAGQTGNLQVDLVTGNYVVRAVGDLGAKPAKLAIGPNHPSSQNDLLLP